MRVLIRIFRAATLAVLLAAAATLAGVAESPGRALAAPAGGGDCYPVNFTWICVYNGGSGGGPGSGGGKSSVTCTYTKAPPGVLQRTGTGPPAPATSGTS